jgi:hypothetical protein
MNLKHGYFFSAQTISLIWHVPYMDRTVFDHKERELHRVCYRIINDENESSSSTIFNGENNEGISDFDLNTYLSQHLPIANETRNEDNEDRIGLMIGNLNETDRRILNLMDYYEKP